jgi:hypothetical protein
VRATWGTPAAASATSAGVPACARESFLATASG